MNRLEDGQFGASPFVFPSRLFFFRVTLTCTSGSERPLASAEIPPVSFFFFFFFLVFFSSFTTSSVICPYSEEGRSSSMDTAASFSLVSISLSLSLRHTRVSPDGTPHTPTTFHPGERKEKNLELGTGRRLTGATASAAAWPGIEVVKRRNPTRKTAGFTEESITISIKHHQGRRHLHHLHHLHHRVETAHREFQPL